MENTPEQESPRGFSPGDLESSTAAPELPFQSRVSAWVAECFGAGAAWNASERAFRFIEEALELGQAAGVTAEECIQLVKYVYGRPVGVVRQEVGGALVTLAALCQTAGVAMDIAGEVELNRCWQNIQKIRAKAANKIVQGALPGTELVSGTIAPGAQLFLVEPPDPAASNLLEMPSQSVLANLVVALGAPDTPPAPGSFDDQPFEPVYGSGWCP